MRLLVFGNSGSGKSTVARRLATEHGLRHLDLDAIVWVPGEIAVQRPAEAIAASLEAFLAGHSHWVIEGCYGELIEAAATRCTGMLFLDPGLETCLAHNRMRTWEPGKYASPDAQDAMLGVLQTWVASYYTRDDAWSHRKHRDVFDAFRGPKSRWAGDGAILLPSPAHVDA